MKVILRQDVKNLGEKGQLVEVSDGYARNFLIPRKLAEEASPVNINIMNMKKEAEKTKKERELMHARAMLDKLKNATLVIKAKAGENGKLFGSITSKDISDAIKKDFDLDIDRKKIHLPDVLKTLGDTEVEIRLYPQAVSKITVKVVRDET